MEVVVAGDGAPVPGPAPATPEPEWPGEVVFVPLDAVPAPGRSPVLELRVLTDGRFALPVYSTATSLVRCCGEAQPYGVLDAARIEELYAACGAEVVGMRAVADRMGAATTGLGDAAGQGGGAPAAGTATAGVLDLLGAVTEAAARFSEATQRSGEAVGQVAADYERTDAAASSAIAGGG